MARFVFVCTSRVPWLSRSAVRLAITGPLVRIVPRLTSRPVVTTRLDEFETPVSTIVPSFVKPVAAMTAPGTQQFRSADDLTRLLLKANVTKGRRMVCYDGSGIAAAKLLFILGLLGHEDTALYDGGWAEWGDRLDLPVDR